MDDARQPYCSDHGKRHLWGAFQLREPAGVRSLTDDERSAVKALSSGRLGRVASDAVLASMVVSGLMPFWTRRCGRTLEAGRAYGQDTAPGRCVAEEWVRSSTQPKRMPPKPSAAVEAMPSDFGLSTDD